MNNWWKGARFASTIVALAAGISAMPPASRAANWPASMKIMVWGASSNSPQWNRDLHVQATRQGCSATPESCIASIEPMAKSSGLKVFLSILLTPQTSIDYARSYGQLSRGKPWLSEIGYDDFVAQYEKMAKDIGPFAAQQHLQNAIESLKAANPNIKFGITLYEFELASPYLGDRRFPPALRAQVDYVHLYTAYRINAPSIATYLEDTRKLFPRAHIIGGLYAYDRQDYLPCGPNTTKCTTTQEALLFARSVETEGALLKKGNIDWLELSPGFFGHEADISDWKSDPRSCLPQRLPECISNTIALREKMLSILNRTALSN